MIKTIEFLRFRGFERLHAHLTPHAYIVGPNSAGKSTVLEAIAIAEKCLKKARKNRPKMRVQHRGEEWAAYPLSSEIDDEDDPVRYEFGTAETRVSVWWSDDACIHIVWPEDTAEDNAPFFYLCSRDGSQPRDLPTTRALFPPVTVVPVVTPLDRDEELKDARYVKKHSATRLASRHFRNHALLMSQDDQWEAYKEFCAPWLPEIQLLDVQAYHWENHLAVFYSEGGTRTPKELAWAGDGIQIWVQLLWHIFRATEAETLVLDEPEVYLHPDLQRRLVRLLNELGAQIILASHSVDVITEAPAEGVLWVDRRTGGARRAKSNQALSALSDSLGSSYNLTLARSMRARLVIASDCEDLRILRMLAGRVGAVNLANENATSLVQLRTVDNWSATEGLGEVLREVLPTHLPAIVLLQAGHRPIAQNKQLVEHLTAPDISVKFWRRAELENYVLAPEAIARVSGAAEESIAVEIADICTQLRDTTRAGFLSAWVATAQGEQSRALLETAEVTFETSWTDIDRRIELVRGTQVMKALNQWLELGGYRTVSGYTLAQVIMPHEVDTEVLRLLLDIDYLLN